ncbi:hypothetical protein ACHAXT_000334 [Thalassiosira profunda]
MQPTTRSYQKSGGGRLGNQGEPKSSIVRVCKAIIKRRQQSQIAKIFEHMMEPPAIKMECNHLAAAGATSLENCCCRTPAGEHDVLLCLQAMIECEEGYLCSDYLDGHHRAASAAAAAAADRPLDRGDGIDESCRSKMASFRTRPLLRVEWIFHVIDSTRLQRETASVAMNYLDRFLGTPSVRAREARSNRKAYQLAAMTCLYIAVKLREPFEMDASLMSRLSRGIHSAEEITTLEYEILIALQWKVNGPTPVQFVNHILELLPESAQSAADVLYEHSHFQTELAVGDYAFVPYVRQSTVAMASILNSLGGVEQDSLPFRECIRFVQLLSQTLGVDLDAPLVNAVRSRLLESFAKSSGYELSQGAIPIPAQLKSPEQDNSFDVSPNCVAKEAAISL